MYPEKKNCGFKNIRIRVDGGLVCLVVIIDNDVNLLEQSGHGSCGEYEYEGGL